MSILKKPSSDSEKTGGFSLKKLAQAASTGVLILCTLLCFVVVVRTALNQEASLFGFRLFYVVTGSMEPTLPVNSLLLVQEQETYQVGDVITYYIRESKLEGYPNTHRIIAVNEDDTGLWYTTQGDANSIPDIQPVRHEDVIGRVYMSFGALVALGSLMTMLTTPSGFFVIVLLPLLSIALICMSEFKKALNEELLRSARAALEAEKTEETKEEKMEEKEAPEHGTE